MQRRTLQYKRIFLWIFFLATTGHIALAYMQSAPGKTVRAYALLYFLIPLLSFAKKGNHTHQYMGIGGGILAVIIVGIGGFSRFSHWASALAILSILSSIDHHQFVMSTKQHIRPWVVASAHSAIFCLGIALSVTLAIMGKNSSFSLTCETMRDTIDTHLATISAPLRITGKQLHIIQQGINTFFTQTPDDVVQEHIIEPFLPAGFLPPVGLTGMAGLTGIAGLTGGDIHTLATMIATVQNSTQNSGQYSTQYDIQNDTLEYYKGLLLDTPLHTKQDLDKKICNVVFDYITEQYAKPGWKISILITLILFFYPLLRFFVMIYAAVISVIYRLLGNIGYITTREEPTVKDVREIE